MSLRSALIQALEDRYNAQISEADATIQIYLEKPVGIGEHPQHLDEIDKLLEARQSDWKDEAVLIILSLPVLVLAWAVISDDPTAMDKVKLFFDMFSQLPSWFTNLWILVVASIYGIKGTQIFRNGGKK